MKKKVNKKEQEVIHPVSDIKLHENGYEYKEIQFTEGVVVTLFNTNKPHRLEGEDMMSYRIRRKLNNNQLRDFLKGQPFYHSASRVPYVKITEEVNK